MLRTPSEKETTPDTAEEEADDRERSVDRRHDIGLVVLWSGDEPDYLGAWVPILGGEGSGGRVLGRGPSRAGDEFPRLSLLRQRPGMNDLLPPFQSEAVSRLQLLVRPLEAELIEVTNIGRRKMLVNANDGDRHQVRPGDVLEIGNRLTLLCAMRPVRLAGSGASTNHPFGQADDHGFVGESPAIWQLRSDIAFAATRAGHVLILGPTGTGKELAAGAVHALSAASGPLISRNATTIPETLIDAELFGNPKGYPNPGVPERAGLIGAAHHGSLFLDEFAELPSASQAHVLRVLDSGEYQRLGETDQRRSEFRLIAATNRSESSLRPDILARFDFRIRVPELVARREDIPLLLHHLYTALTRDDAVLRERFSLPSGLPRLDRGFVRQLLDHPFPGNVRELRHLLWRSLAESSSSALQWPTGVVDARDGAGEPAEEGETLSQSAVQRALDANNGSLEKTWRSLRLPNRYALRRLIRKHGLAVTRRRGA